MARKLPALSPSETEILRLVWSLQSATVQHVRNALPAGRKIGYATVQTLLRRLEKKGYVSHTSQGKAHVFSPAVRREEVVRRTVGEFVNRLFGGDPVPLMMHLVDRTDLNDEEMKRLQELLQQTKSKP